jgi:hypothetical protein
MRAAKSITSCHTEAEVASRISLYSGQRTERSLIFSAVQIWPLIDGIRHGGRLGQLGFDDRVANTSLSIGAERVPLQSQTAPMQRWRACLSRGMLPSSAIGGCRMRSR